MKTQMLITAALFAVMPLAGCASIISSPNGKWHGDCPQGKAEVTIVNERSGETVFTGTTPTGEVELKRGAGFFRPAKYTVTFSKAGYASQSHEIKTGISGWYIAGNFFFGGLIGWVVVDPLTGAMWTLERSYSAELTPLATSSASDAKDLNIVSLADVPNDLRTHLRRVN